MVELSRHFFSNLERFQPHAFLSLRSLGECSEASLCRSFAAERSMQAVVAVWPLLSSRKPPCTRCSRQEAVAKSTAMEGSHIKLRKRLVAVCLVVDDAYLGKGGPASRLRNRRDPARRRVERSHGGGRKPSSICRQATCAKERRSPGRKTCSRSCPKSCFLKQRHEGIPGVMFELRIQKN